MANNLQIVSVITKDNHSVNLYDVSKNGNFMRNVFITNGDIIGQPVVSGNICTITCMEKGRTVIRTYEMPSFKFKNIINL